MRRSAPEEPRARVARAAAEVAALLRAGAGPAAAWAPQQWENGRLSEGSPDAVERALDSAARAAAAGEDPAAALRNAPLPPTARRAVEALALTWRTSQVTGAPSAAVLERLAASLADDAAAQDAHDAALAGPRATARLLLALPAAGLLLGTALGADPAAVLLGTTAGRWCAAAGASCALAGWGWSALLVRAAAAGGR